ncbi:unnamed protein product [Lactuca saligna]|uniref:Uncharacterized protein n=1 Tax=Lactuca saligna TaxID=75948 RepID=A0AA36E2K3_LACSI|nr:unnamed protein product [Lactuca saligna]
MEDESSNPTCNIRLHNKEAWFNYLLASFGVLEQMRKNCSCCRQWVRESKNMLEGLWSFSKHLMINYFRVQWFFRAEDTVLLCLNQLTTNLNHRGWMRCYKSEHKGQSGLFMGYVELSGLCTLATRTVGFNATMEERLGLSCNLKDGFFKFWAGKE